MAPIEFARLWRAELDENIASNPDFAAGLYASLSHLDDANTQSAVLDDVVSQPGDGHAVTGTTQQPKSRSAYICKPAGTSPQRSMSTAPQDATETRKTTRTS
jgi:hypothetical protein